ncbi:hypothetical protein GCM10009599_15210 [Luteococcus peritonei]
MIENTTSEQRKDWIGLLARLVLGGALLVAGALKLPNLDANVLTVRAYKLPIPYELVKLIGYGLPVLEVLLGLAIVLGLLTRWTALLGTLMMLVFIAGIASLWIRGLKVDCGCFGGGGATEDPHYLREIIRDVVFALAGAWLIWRPRSRFALDDWLFPPIPTRTDLDHETDDEDLLVGEDTPR